MRHPMPVHFVTVFLIVCSACHGQGNTTEVQTNASVSSEGTSSIMTASSGGATSPTTTSPTDATTTSSGGECPNGIVNANEACDDGNMVDGDGCNNDCTKSGSLIKDYKSGNPLFEEFRDVAILSSGKIVVVGQQGDDRWVGQFDDELALSWSKTYDSAPKEKLTSVVATPDAIYAVGGVTPVLDPNPKTEIRSAWIGQLTLDGDVAWEKTWANPLGDVYFSQVSLANDGDLVTAGLMAVDQSTLGIFVRRYTKAGEEKWTSSFPINFNDNSSYPLGPGLAVTAESVYAGWGVWINGGVDETLAAFPLGGGAPSWTKTLSETSGVIYAVSVDTHTADLVIGSNSGNFSELTLRRAKANGEIVWASNKCTGGTARAVAVDSNGNYVVIGDGEGAVGANVRLCKFTPDGALLWGQDIDSGVGDDRGYSVDVLPSGQIVAVGAFAAGPTDRDGWIAIYAP